MVSPNKLQKYKKYKKVQSTHNWFSKEVDMSCPTKVQKYKIHKNTKNTKYKKNQKKYKNIIRAPAISIKK